MGRTIYKLLFSDLILRFLGLAGFTIFIGAVYDVSGKASDVGLVSLATALPSLFALAYANAYTRRFSALGVLRGVTWLRLIAFASLLFLPISPLLIMLAAGLQSLSHQIAITGKMTLDAQMLDDAQRRRYLARKAMLTNVAVISAPACGGLLVGLLGFKIALFTLIGANVCLAALLATIPAMEKEGQQHIAAPPNLLAALRNLLQVRRVAAVVGVYCIMAAVLEIQAPLVFPFVHEVYGASSVLGGTLLGLCGFGGLLGAYATEAWPKYFSPSAIPLLILCDGLLFFAFTQISNLPVACILFVFLGSMGSITLIVVEGVVQTDADANNQPFIFSMMQFSGGAGGASLGVAAAFLAERYTTRLVLGGAALLESLLGILCLILLGGALRLASASALQREE
jgi:hypothetical protein